MLPTLSSFASTSKTRLQALSPPFSINHFFIPPVINLSLSTNMSSSLDASAQRLLSGQVIRHPLERPRNMEEDGLEICGQDFTGVESWN